MQGKKYTIFIVDTDLNHANQIKDHLANHHHYHFFLFATPEECEAKLHLNPALIFLDYELNPDKRQSSEILKFLKTISPNTEIVLFTGTESIEVIKDSMHHGAYDYYIKDHHAHLKAEYLIVQILHKHQLKEEIQKQKKTIKFLFTVIAILTITASIMYFTGFIKDKYIGGHMF